MENIKICDRHFQDRNSLHEDLYKNSFFFLNSDARYLDFFDIPYCFWYAILPYTHLVNYVPRTSWWRFQKMSYGHLHMVLYVTPWDVFYQRPENVPIRGNIYLRWTCSTDTLRMSLKDVTSSYGFISKAKKTLRDNDFCIWSSHQ